MWCGPKNCLRHANLSEPVVTCGRDERCVLHVDDQCFSPPCLPRGVCKKRGGDVSDVINPPYTHATQCRPGEANYGFNCIKMMLVFDMDRVPIVSWQMYYCEEYSEEVWINVSLVKYT